MARIIVGLYTRIAEVFWTIVESLRHYDETTIAEFTIPESTLIPDRTPNAVISIVTDGKWQALVLQPMNDNQVSHVLACLRDYGYIVEIGAVTYSDIAEFNPWHQPISHDLEDSQYEWDV
jgi:hypothetical protein